MMMKGALLLPSHSLYSPHWLSNVPLHASVSPCASPPLSSYPFFSHSRVKPLYPSTSSSSSSIFRKRLLNGSIGPYSISSGRNNCSLWYKSSIEAINGYGQEGIQGGKEENDKLKTVPFDWKKVNKIVLTGKLGRDFTLKTVSTGKILALSSLAVQRPHAGEVDWFTLEVWERLAEKASANLSKGDKVTAEGKIKLRYYLGRDGQPKTEVKVVASSFRFGDKFLNQEV